MPTVRSIEYSKNLGEYPNQKLPKLSRGNDKADMKRVTAIIDNQLDISSIIFFFPSFEFCFYPLAKNKQTNKQSNGVMIDEHGFVLTNTHNKPSSV